MPSFSHQDTDTHFNVHLVGLGWILPGQGFSSDLYREAGNPAGSHMSCLLVTSLSTFNQLYICNLFPLPLPIIMIPSVFPPEPSKVCYAFHFPRQNSSKQGYLLSLDNSPLINADCIRSVVQTPFFHQLLWMWTGTSGFRHFKVPCWPESPLLAQVSLYPPLSYENSGPLSVKVQAPKSSSHF